MISSINMSPMMTQTASRFLPCPLIAIGFLRTHTRVYFFTTVASWNTADWNSLGASVSVGETWVGASLSQFKGQQLKLTRQSHVSGSSRVGLALEGVVRLVTGRQVPDS